MKPGLNIKAVWLWSALAAILVTLSGILYEFNYETNWAYFVIGLVCVGLTVYTFFKRK
jgi:uncharacterized membrane protein